jgi:hypothetical protein
MGISDEEAVLLQESEDPWICTFCLNHVSEEHDKKKYA